MGVRDRGQHVQEQAEARRRPEPRAVAVAVDASRRRRVRARGRAGRSAMTPASIRWAMWGCRRRARICPRGGSGPRRRGRAARVQQLHRHRALVPAVAAVGQPDAAHAALADRRDAACRRPRIWPAIDCGGAGAALVHPAGRIRGEKTGLLDRLLLGQQHLQVSSCSGGSRSPVVASQAACRSTTRSPAPRPGTD